MQQWGGKLINEHEERATSSAEDREEGKREVKAGTKEDEEHGRGSRRKETEGESKWSMELNLFQLTTAGVLGVKVESVHPH